VDAIVIGGGPGGSTAATMLARKGWRVVLFEREHFPREHIGESLLPASMPILEDLGVLDAVASEGFLQKWGATMVWGSGNEPWSWFFRETNRRYPHAYQVWRPRFDQILLESSRSHGVDVREGHRVLDVTLNTPGAHEVRYRSDDGEGAATARFVVDASGQEGLLGRSLRLRQPDDYFRNLAVYAYFEGASRLPSEAENNILIESYPHGWFWAIPLHTGWMSVGAVVDSEKGQEGIRRLGPQGFLAEQIAESPHVAGMLAGARQVRDAAVLRDWSYLSTEVVGDGYILVGDAACFIDPLFSSGVHLAMTAGILASAYVTTVLKDPAMAAPAGAVYKELYYQQYGQFRELAKLFYASNRSVDSYFWEARRITRAGDGVTPREAFVRAVAGQPPKGYERAVLQRGTLPSDFSDALDELERGRAERAAHFEHLLQGDADSRRLLLQSAPAPAAGAYLERKPVLVDGEFAWGNVITTTNRPEGAPVSDLVARLFQSFDGEQSLGDVLRGLTTGVGDDARDAVLQSCLSALQVLYVDGAVTGLDSR
jgi:flavin-dependent dehydrogenase